MPSTAGLVEVIIYSSPDDKKKNRGFCFLEYESHKAASLAKRRLGTGRIKVLPDTVTKFVENIDLTQSTVCYRFGVVILLSIGRIHKKNPMNQL